MNWFKRNPRLGAVLIVSLLALAAEAWLLQRARQQAARARAALEQKKQERDRLARQSPAPSEENEQAIARDVAQAQKVLAALRSALQGTAGAHPAVAPPASSIDAYFDIAAFVEKTRTAAASAQVMIKPDEHFGFAAHAQEGPETELVPAVIRQRLAGQYLVETLLASHPRALLTMQREHPLTEARLARRNQREASGVDTVNGSTGPEEPQGDFFGLDGRLSLRVPGRVESQAFRIEFTGQTPALRAFLNALATFTQPVIVRSVEVEPLNAEGPGAIEPTVGAPVPLVSQNLSKFSIIVECIEPVGSAAVPSS